MLDPWIIEEIRRREQERHDHREQPSVEAPEYAPARPDRAAPESERRGVIVIEIL